jgi:UDP-glucose 4-epimerase
MASYVVTGGAGFIGSHIAGELAASGARVVVLDNFSTGKEANLRGLAGTVEVRKVDLSDPGLEEHLEGADAVFHQAAIPSVPLSVQDPVSTHRANVTGSLNLLVAARDAGVGRVVCASSSAVYGDDPELPKRETMLPSPVSPYGAQKYMMEICAQTFSRTYGLETVCLRYFNVFGPRQDASSEYSGVFARFIPAVLEGRRPVIFGDGLQTRDFLFVSDVVGANLAASRAAGVSGETFNIARGERTTVRTVLDEIQALTGSRIGAALEPSRPGDIRHSQADVTKALHRLDWTPVASLRDGLRETIDWYRENL